LGPLLREDTARRLLAVKIGDLAAGRGGLKVHKPAGPLAQLVEAWLKDRRGTHRPISTSTVGGTFGHSTVLVTERYAHLKPELFQEADLLSADVSLGSAT
jgi:hypothetical protein